MYPLLKTYSETIMMFAREKKHNILSLDKTFRALPPECYLSIMSHTRTQKEYINFANYGESRLSMPIFFSLALRSLSGQGG